MTIDVIEIVALILNILHESTLTGVVVESGLVFSWRPC